jgi:hypothetical protein
MGQNGGARPGAGRRPKADEIKIIEQMDAIAVPRGGVASSLESLQGR